MSTVDTENQVHADGKTLLAVAEGNAERQPDDALLSHIFSCDQCGATLQELRQGLSGLAMAKTAPRSEPRSAQEVLDAAQEFDVAEEASIAAEERARRMIWKLAIVGGLLALGMWWFQSSTASHL